MRSNSIFTAEDMAQRLVRYDELRPCTTAFIDARTPGSDRKENFTIIGPGVAENPDQHVHIRIPHGFNIGAARQPPHCVNSQHSHQTAEVFIVHSGQWRFRTGERGDDGQVELAPGDVISVPVKVFRGFENIGTDVGFMFAVLGGDDPGRVTWAPHVFDAASQHGLLLLENGRLVDTTREQVPSDAKPMPRTTDVDVAQLRRLSSDALAGCVARAAEFTAGGGLSKSKGFEECPIIGPASSREGLAAGKLSWPHGFQLRVLRVAAHARGVEHSRDEEEVLLMHSGKLTVEWQSQSLMLLPGDTLTVPPGLARQYANLGTSTATLYIVRGGDQPAAPQQS